MKKLKLPLQWKWNSLFAKLMASFLIMILLLLSFNVLSFTSYKRNIHEDIIKYNSLEFTKTVGGYETHFDMLKEDLIKLLLSPPVNSVMRHGDQYDLMKVLPATEEIQSLVNNQLLMLKHIIIYSPDRSYTVEEGATDTSQDLFATRLSSDAYPLSYWQQLSRQEFAYRILPAAEFTSEALHGNSYVEGHYFPIIMKNSAVESVMIIALLDSEAMYRSFQLFTGNPFLLYDDSGRTLYQSRTGDKPAVQLEDLPEDRSHRIIDDQYLFYSQGAVTGYTYVQAVPIAYINARLSKMTFYLVAILIASLVLGLAISVFLSLRFNSPIRRMIASIQSSGSSPFTSNIAELNLISSTIASHRNQLQHYRYVNQLKRVHQGKDAIDTDSPFYLILFEIAYSRNFRSLTSIEQDKASSYIKEYVHVTLTENFPETTTIHIEQNQILSLVEASASPEAILHALHRLKEVLDRDNAYCLLTIVFEPKLRMASGLADSYEESAGLLVHRKLVKTTQIITQTGTGEEALSFTAQQEQELSIQLQAGDPDKAMRLVKDFLLDLAERDASAVLFKAYAKEVVAKIFKALVSMNMEIGAFMERHVPYETIQQCMSLEELETFLETLIQESTTAIADTKALLDPVKDFVLSYIQEHYNQDISLETAARKLNMSRSYLSTYFRDKTGKTFTDYVNDLRIARAKELLEGGELRVQEVAEQVGYENANSFIRMFKKLTGITPGEYRKALLTER